MVYSGRRVAVILLILLSLVDIGAYAGMAQASLPLPPPPLLQGIPQLPGAEPAIPPIETAAPEPTPAIDIPQGQPQPPFNTDNTNLLTRIDRLDNKIANIEEQIRTLPQPQIPGIVKSPFSFNILLIVNIITFALVVYLLFKSQEKSVGPRHRIETKPLKNIKDYMRRYQAQGYQIDNMKTFLISQGYPRDLVEQAARDMEAESSFKF